MLPETLGNSGLKRIIKFYSKVFVSKYGFVPMISYPRIGKLFKPILEQFSENQIALMIVIHFDWRGVDGNDTFTHRRMVDACHPLDWLPKNINQYQAFIRNVLNINFDNDEDIIEIIKEYI